MDPDAALAAIRDITEKMIDIADAQDDPPTDDARQAEYLDHANDLIVLVQGLDQWIARGGRLPAGWKAAQEFHQEAPQAAAPTTLYAVVEEWTEGEERAVLVGVYSTRDQAESVAQADRKYWAETFETPKIVWCYPTDDDQDPDWDVDVQVDEITLDKAPDFQG